ncbi:MAG: GNAT family N-acetyltransferase [Candidatus Aenigmatarchaeota archaeon]
MEIIYTDKINWQEWNNFCLHSSSGWFRHTKWFLDYVIDCRFDKKSKNLSFAIKENNKIVAIVPLIIQTIYNEPDLFEFAIGDTNTPYPAFDNYIYLDNKKNITKAIFLEIERLAKENKVSYVRFFLDPLCDDILEKKQIYNPLPKYGFCDTSLSTNIINLTISEEDIFSRIRKGHKADIKTAIKNCFVVDIFDKENITEEKFKIYKNLHYLASGRKTRPDESWEDMFRFIKEDYAILALERKDKSFEYIAGIFVITYKQKAYYGSGATHPNFEKIRGIGHLLHWEVIKYLKNRRYKYYEIGWNYYPIISQETIDQKLLGISHFKSGFGDTIYPLFRGEKFFSKEYFMKIYKKRLDNYANSFLCI